MPMETPLFLKRCIIVTAIFCLSMLISLVASYIDTMNKFEMVIVFLAPINSICMILMALMNWKIWPIKNKRVLLVLSSLPLLTGIAVVYELGSHVCG
jgi:hypothetical protein